MKMQKSDQLVLMLLLYFTLLAILMRVAQAQDDEQCVANYCDYEKDNATLRELCYKWYNEAYNFAKGICPGQLPSYVNWILSGPCRKLPVNSTERELCYFAAPNAASNASGYTKGHADGFAAGQASVEKGHSDGAMAGLGCAMLVAGGLLWRGSQTLWGKFFGKSNVVDEETGLLDKGPSNSEL